MPQPGQEAEDLGLGLVVFVPLEVERPGPLAGSQVRRIVGQGRVVHREIQRVAAEPVHAPIQPEPRGVQQRVLHLLQPRVQLRLRAEEIVHVVLAAPRIPGPGRAAEHRLPVRRRRPVRLGVGPDVPIGLGVGAVPAALLEPGVGVGGVGVDLIDDDLQAQLVRTGDQPVEILDRAEDRIDPDIVRDVVTEILHRRGEEGRQPDPVDAQRRDMIQMRRDPRQVADPVAVGVGIGARIDLIDHRAPPPLMAGLRI